MDLIVQLHQDADAFAVKYELLPPKNGEYMCKICHFQMTYEEKWDRYACYKKNRHPNNDVFMVGRTKGSIFHQSKLSKQHLIEVMFYWLEGWSYERIMYYIYDKEEDKEMSPSTVNK